MRRATVVTSTCTLALTLLAGPGYSAAALEVLPLYGDPKVVPDNVLDEQRGGFFNRDGMQIAIGLEQVAYVNGEEVHRSVLRELTPLSDPTALASGAMEQVLIRTGIEGSDVLHRVGGPLDSQGWMTVIQNEVNGQRIQHATIMQLELSNIALPRSDLGRALEQELIGVTRNF